MYEDWRPERDGAWSVSYLLDGFPAVEWARDPRPLSAIGRFESFRRVSKVGPIEFVPAHECRRVLEVS